MKRHARPLILILSVACLPACDMSEFTGKKKEDVTNGNRAQCVIRKRSFAAIAAIPVPVSTPAPRNVDAELCRMENLKCDQTIFSSDNDVANESTTEAVSIRVGNQTLSTTIPTVVISTSEAVRNNPSLFQELNYVEARCFLGSDVHGQADSLDAAAKLALDECNLRR